MSTGNGWRLLACQVIPLLVFVPALVLLDTLATPESRMAELLATAVSLPAMVVGLVILSCAYRRLSAAVPDAAAQAVTLA